MTHTIPTDYIGRQDLCYALLALPSKNFKRRVRDLLADLVAELPGVIWPMPPEQLHITLCEIIQAKSYSQDKEALFNSHQERYETAPGAVLSRLPKFTVTFDVVEVSPQAIIIRASDSSMFNDIRAKLLEAMELPRETRTPPDITHSSIARYLSAVDITQVQEAVSRHSLTIEEEITEFKLLRTTTLPLEKYEIVGSFPLAVLSCRALAKSDLTHPKSAE